MRPSSTRRARSASSWLSSRTNANPRGRPDIRSRGRVSSDTCEPDSVSKRPRNTSSVTLSGSPATNSFRASSLAIRCLSNCLFLMSELSSRAEGLSSSASGTFGAYNTSSRATIGGYARRMRRQQPPREVWRCARVFSSATSNPHRAEPATKGAVFVPPPAARLASADDIAGIEQPQCLTHRVHGCSFIDARSPSKPPHFSGRNP
jgi:hypothetical protein